MAILSQTSLLGRAIPSKKVRVTSPYQMQGTLQSDVAYDIQDNLDWSGSGVSIEVPATGLFIVGDNQAIRSINVADNDYTLFTSPIGGSGNLFVRGVTFRISGTNSRVYGLTDATGFNAIEVEGVNYENCTSLGEWIDYRQGLEFNTGRFGGTPELTLSGSMNGFRINTSIVRGMSNFTALFKAGTALTFNGRFITDINCDLPTIGALLDFSPANFTTEELLQLNGCQITRDGAFNPNDTGITPNIANTNIQSLFKDNVGIRNTKKYLRATCTAEVTTPLSGVAAGTYLPLEGVVTVDKASHISMPSNGEYEVLSGSSTYSISGDLTVRGTANDVIDIRVTKSTDGGATYPFIINHVRRVINNSVGPRDVAFLPISFVEDLDKGDRLRLEGENVFNTNDITMEIDSFISIKED